VPFIQFKREDGRGERKENLPAPPRIHFKLPEEERPDLRANPTPFPTPFPTPHPTPFFDNPFSLLHFSLSLPVSSSLSLSLSLPSLLLSQVSIADDIAAAFGSMKNDYPELPFAMGFSGDKNEHQQDAWDLHMNKDGSIPPARVVSSSTVASATATATGSVSEKDENVVMETIATALAGGENDYPELPFPTGYSGEANNKFRDAFDYGMTKGSGKN
jgi:hypothetical protein